MFSDGHVKVDTGPKIYTLSNGAYIACCGDADWRDALELIGSHTEHDMPSRKVLADLKLEFGAIVVFPSNKVFIVEIAPVNEQGNWTAQCTEQYEDFVALGAGLEFAYGVLEAGGTPKEAVEAACKRSLYCGPPVKVVNIPETGQKKSVKKRVKIDE